MGVRIEKREDGKYLGFNDRADKLAKELDDMEDMLRYIRKNIDARLTWP